MPGLMQQEVGESLVWCRSASTCVRSVTLHDFMMCFDDLQTNIELMISFDGDRS